ncbi:MAG: lysophospholipid acyltransferase family protein [Porticoccaceae bacterium]|nr:lysophospholipid acyltransferase family protein [Porticoccaceae bacterium]
MGKRTDRNARGWLGYYGPRFWLSWLAVGSSWVLAKLPRAAQRGLIRGLTSLIIKTKSSRAKTIRRNIELCFPELSNQEREALVADNIYSTIWTLFDLLALVWDSRDSVLSRARIIGEQHLRDALSANQPLILVTGHSCGLALGVAKLTEVVPFSVVYRRMDNPVLEAQIYQRATKTYPIKAIHRKEIPYMLTDLADQGVVLIAPDQDFGTKHGTFIPFFGIDTATITNIPQYAKSADARVLLFHTYREADGNCVVEIEPVLENYPSGDDLADTHVWSDYLERQVHKHAADYFWLHKRFKTRPEGEKKLY